MRLVESCAGIVYDGSADRYCGHRAGGVSRSLVAAPTRASTAHRSAWADAWPVVCALRSPGRTPLGLAQRLLRRALAARAGYAHGRLLDVGCGVQPYRGLFPEVARYIGLDRPGTARCDVCGDGLALPFRDETFDTVLCNQVLEHVPEGPMLVAEIARVLKPRGILLLTVPLTWGLHLEPNDFYRYTRYGLQYVAEKSGLGVLEIAPTCGLWATLAQRLVDTVIYNYGRRWPWWLVECMSVVLAPLLMLAAIVDRLVGQLGDTLDWVMVARKL